ncbi:hypothetical protein ACFLUR_03975 [Chloroflexota bacterium]
MIDGHSREHIIEKVITYFRNTGFKPEEYSERWQGEVRIPLYFQKSWKDEHGETQMEEVVVDVITESSVSEIEYLPPLTVDSMTIDYACPPRFFQLYLPRAKVYWAISASINKDENYDRFIKACKKNGIGLIEVSDKNVTIIEDAKSFLEDFNERIRDSIARSEPLLDESQEEVEQSEEVLLNKSDLTERIGELTNSFCEEYIRRLVYYGDPVFRRREVAGRTIQNLSLKLMDKVAEVKNLQYGSKLVEIANGYRKEIREDYQIALDTVKNLWKQRFQIDYPDVGKDFEAVLRLHENYRDHFLHEFQVFLIGAIIIDVLYYTKPLRDFERVTGSAIEDAWLAASTYHDFDYAIQNYEDWIKDFFEQFLHIEGGVPVLLNLEGVVVRNDFLSKLNDICANINYNLDDCMVRFIFEKAVLERNHAVLATLSFLNRFNNNLLTKPATNLAALAILLHEESNWRAFCGRSDCKTPWEIVIAQNPIMTNLTFEALPLAFLLAYCDVAQEWGRVGRNYDIANPELVEFIVNEKEISLYMKIEDDDCFKDKRNEILRLRRFLKDERFTLAIQLRTSKPQKFRMTGK